MTYRYIGHNPEIDAAMSKSGSLVECYRLALRCYNRLGMTGDILRPDGSSISAKARRVNLP